MHNQQTSDSQSFNVIRQPKNKVDYDIVPKHVSHDESLSSTSVQSHFVVDQSFDKLKKDKKLKLQPHIHNSHEDSVSSTSVQSHVAVDKTVINSQKDKTPKLQPYIHNSQSELEPFKSATGLESLGSTNVQSHFEVDQSVTKLKKVPNLQSYIPSSQRELEPWKQATILEEKPICNMSNKQNEIFPKNKETIPNIKCDPFQNVTDELAVILKRRQQMSEHHVSDTSWRTTVNKSSLSTRWSSASSVNLTNDTDKKPASKPKTKRCNSNMVEYVMKYEYKGQAHGQQNIYLQKGEAIYADLNSQNSTEWIWVHIPRTNQCGYVPSSYAERQTTVVL